MQRVALCIHFIDVRAEVQRGQCYPAAHGSLLVLQNCVFSPCAQFLILFSLQLRSLRPTVYWPSAINVTSDITSSKPQTLSLEFC